MTAEWVAILGAIGAALITALGTIIARRAGKPVDMATVRKSEQEVAATAVATARALIEEVREHQLEQKAEYEQKLAELRAKHDAELDQVRDRIRDLETRHNRLVVSLRAHQPWDTDTGAKLREYEPGWPSPPPFDGM